MGDDGVEGPLKGMERVGLKEWKGYHTKHGKRKHVHYLQVKYGYTLSGRMYTV